MHVITGVQGAFLEDYIESELPAEVDIAASISRFAEVLFDRIRGAYPTTSVEVRCDLDIIDGIPWDHQTYVLDPLPDVSVVDLVRNVETLRRSITTDEWIIYRPSLSESGNLYLVGEMGYQEQSSV